MQTPVAAHDIDFFGMKSSTVRHRRRPTVPDIVIFSDYTRKYCDENYEERKSPFSAMSPKSASVITKNSQESETGSSSIGQPSKPILSRPSIIKISNATNEHLVYGSKIKFPASSKFETCERRNLTPS